MRKLLISTVALLGLMVMGVQGAPAATTHWVNDDELTPAPPGTSCSDAGYTSIQAAVNAASPGDTIKVCPGLYAEQVNVNKNNLTLLGAQAGVDARTRAFVPDPTTQSIIDDPCGPVQFTADNLELNGFTVQGSTLSDPCFLSGIWSNPGYSGTNGGFSILYNIVQNNISGIELDSNCTNSTLVQFNLIQNNNNSGPGSGNGIQTNFGLCNATIDSNKFSGHTNSSFLVVTPSSNLNVTNNELVGGTLERIVFALVSTATISSNVSIGSTSSGTIRLFGGNSTVTINSNTLFNGMRGIFVDDPFGIGANSSIDAHFNCIDGNSVAGLEVTSGAYTGTLNAENNWWGSASGPTNPNNPGGMGDAIIDPDGVVDFIPFLKSCPTGPAAPSMVTGGGQINVTGGRGSFGFSAKQDTQSGHLDYMNHVTRKHLNCKVDAVMILSTTKAKLSGTCTPQSDASSFTADVEDNDKTMDKFKITYPAPVGTTEGDTIRSGNIQIK